MESACLQGKYIYFSPLYRPLPNSVANMHHGLIVRYNTRRGFGSKYAWEMFDTMSIRSDLGGFSGCESDGRFVYFNPTRFCSVEPSGLFLRFDTQGNFFNPASYQTIDIKQWNPDFTDYHGYSSFDGKNMYFCAAGRAAIMAKFRTMN
jgi:hypothetical protein